MQNKHEFNIYGCVCDFKRPVSSATSNLESLAEDLASGIKKGERLDTGTSGHLFKIVGVTSE